MFRKKLISAVLGVVAATTFMAPAAQADDTLGVASCLLTGLTGHSDPVNSFYEDFLIEHPFLWVLDTDISQFAFSGNATCGAVDVASSGVYTSSGGWAVAAGSAFSVSAGGTFNNLVCGTGTANGTANISGPANVLALGSAGNTDIDATFTIRFTATAGLLEIAIDPGADGTGGNEIGTNVVTGGGGLGVIQILPTGGSCLTGPGVTAFTVNGAFELNITG